jgi:two-component system, cell cycle sensor histidine kinase and response regulator CckA
VVPEARNGGARARGLSVRLTGGLAEAEAKGGKEITTLTGIAAQDVALKAREERLEALARLSSRISHDLNNVLTTVTGYSEFILERMGGYAKYSPFLRDIEEIKRAGDRAASLTRQLLAFSGRQVLSPRAVDVNEIIKGMEQLLGRMMGDDVRLMVELAPDLEAVRVDPGQLEQALLALAVNARDAMPQGGSVVLRTGRTELPESEPRASWLSPGPYVTIRVEDTGAGMDADTMNRLFEPFFSTKGADQALGLGLATVYGFVRQSGGEVRVESRLGEGTRLELLFPAVPEPAEADHQDVRVQALFGSETVLVVDDEEGIRTLIRNILQRKGYTVLEASSGEHAQRVLEQHEGSIDLLVSDIQMPGIDGAELASELRKSRPEMPVLFISSDLQKGLVEQFGRKAGFLMKPFTIDMLLRKVREVLEQQEKNQSAEV